MRRRRLAEYLAASGRLGRPLDMKLLATSGHTHIWHTEKVDPGNCPRDVPNGFVGVLHRGFRISQLQSVLQYGTDVPAQAAFYAEGLEKAWEYACGNRADRMVSVLVLDRSQTRRSFQTKPDNADASWTPDIESYPHRYVDGATEVFTRFEPAWGTTFFLDEVQYGHWIPGDARGALQDVYIGGNEQEVRSLLQKLVLPDAYRIIAAEDLE